MTFLAFPLSIRGTSEVNKETLLGAHSVGKGLFEHFRIVGSVTIAEQISIIYQGVGI